jgi:heptosyltransferase III
VPRLERLITVEKKPWSLHWLALYAAVALTRWDIVLDLRGSALAYVLRAGKRLGEVKARDGEHRVAQLARILALDPPPAPVLYLAPSHERIAAELVPPGAPVLAIGPAANWRGKQWRGERFAELALRLTAPGGILAGARVAVLAAGAVLRRAALFVGNDTGLMHIAAAAGAPTLGLFGPTQSSRYAPWGARTAAAQTAIPPLALYGPDFDHRTTDTMMDSLSVDSAAAAAENLWRSVAGEAA